MFTGRVASWAVILVKSLNRISSVGGKTKVSRVVPKCIVVLILSGWLTGLDVAQVHAQRGAYSSQGFTTTPASQSWAQSLFREPNHNFGTVARAAKAEHAFTFTNNFDQPIEILSVNASCTCIRTEVPKKVVQPGEEGQILAKYQTLAMTGQKGATMNVSLRKGHSVGTAMLRAEGFIRQDVVIHPGSVEIPRVIAADGATNKIKILYAGRNDWKITDIKCEHPGMEVQVQEVLRKNGRVEYEVETTIARDLPVGLIQDVITLFTNDRNLTSFPVAVSVNVVQPIRFADTLELRISEGDTAIERLLMASSSDFQIIDFECEGCPIQVKLDGEKKKVHQLEVAAEGLQEGRSEHLLKLTTNHPLQPVANIRLIIDVQTGR
jgi:hypothetical protein